MSAEPLEVVREYLELVVEDRDSGAELLHPDVVWHGTRGGIDERRTHRGPDAVRAYIDEIGESWERLEIEVEEMFEIGDAIVVFLRETATTRHGGPEILTETATVFRVHGGRIIEIRGYLDREEAVATTGSQAA